jgi:ferredoxin
MVIVTHQREKCIGCNYCVELHFERWRMSKKDGKATLIGGVEKKGFHTVRLGDDEFEQNIAASKACPVNIISVKKVDK